VTAIKREPTPLGPVTDLFERLHNIHLAAGQPSMRQIASSIGRGVISSSTIHNMFRGPRVPKWGFLELVVEELHGDQAEFRALWQAARLAEEAEAEKDQGAAGPSGYGRLATLPSERGMLITALAATAPGEPGAAGSPRRIWSNEIPRRNLHFTGRAAELMALRANLVRSDRPHPSAQIISGPGGVGKTELAVEYLHQYRDEYEIVWWIRAEHHDRVRDALVSLAQRLEARPAGMETSRDQTIAAVLNALAAGVRPNWLLVYDNAVQPLDLQRYLPPSPPGGHIIITSRLQNWPGYIEADNTEVSPFTEQESISFLRHRVPSLGANPSLQIDEDERRASEAARLATALGHLPIAIEHAAAYLTETGQSVGDYLTHFEENASRPPTEQLPPPVSAAWVASTALLTSDAEHLLNLCAFFSPEPIATELLLNNAQAVSEPPGLRELLSSSPRFRAAASQLHRLSLVKVDGARDQIQMHRVVQAVTRDQLRQNRPDAFLAYRAAVETLLAESNPGDPDRASNDVVYDLSLQHLESERNFLDTRNPALRRLIIDQVRRLRLRGAHVEAMQFGQDTLRVWRERLGPDDVQVLNAAVEVAVAMQLDGHVADARRLLLDTLSILEARYGDQHEVTLLCSSAYAADLRTRGQFSEALELDSSLLLKFEYAFGSEHERTLSIRNNIAADYRRLGRYPEALDIDQRTFEYCRRILGSNDPRTLHSYDMMADDVRRLGRYQESLDIVRKVVQAYTAAGGRENPDWLNARTDFAAALRKAGYYWEALQESEEVVQRYRDYLGSDHAFTLRASVNLINDRRSVGALVIAEELGLETYDRSRFAGTSLDIMWAAVVSLASVLRARGRPEEARHYDLQALDVLIAVYGDLHPFTLAASTNYATDLALCGELAEAIRIGQDCLASSRRTLGPDHPDTLITAVNLASDVGAAGDQTRAERLREDALRRYKETLTMEHPEAQAAAQGVRLTAEIEPF
jgi:tetratricopeptide (TPR) repeat protein